MIQRWRKSFHRTWRDLEQWKRWVVAVVVLVIFVMWRRSGSVTEGAADVPFVLRRGTPRLLEPARLDVNNWPGSAFRPPVRFSVGNSTLPPLVSVLVPAYNTECALLQAAIRSVVYQTLQRFLIHLADDGSTASDMDACLSSLEHEYGAIIRVSRLPHMGVAHVRNFLLQSVYTPYLVFVDSDDLLEPTFLEKTVWFLETHPQFAIAGADNVGFGAKEYTWSQGWHNGDQLFTENFATVTQVVRTSVARQVGYYDISMDGGNEDWHFWLKIAKEGFWGFTVPDFLSWYRLRSAEERAKVWPNLFANADSSRRKLVDQFEHARQQVVLPKIRPFSVQDSYIVANSPFENSLLESHTSKRCSVLLAVPYLSMGGADKLTVLLAQQMVTEGCRVTIVCDLHMPPTSRWAMSELLSFTEDIHFLPTFVKPADFLSFFLYIIRSRNIDRMVINNSMTAYMISSFLKKLVPHVAIAAYCHMWEHFWLDGGYARIAKDKSSAGALDHVFVCHDHLRERMIELGVPASQISTAYLGVDTTKLNTYKRPPVGKGFDEHLRVYFVGRLTEQKRPLLLIEILGRLTDLSDSIEFHVLGEGSMRDLMEVRAKQLGVESMITYHGKVAFDKVYEHYNQGHVLLLPSRNEGISMAMMEAMLFGLVPVVSDVGGHSEVISDDCECGYVLPYEPDLEKESLAYAKVLRTLAGHSAFRKLMSDKAAARVRLFDQSKLIPLLSGAIRSVPALDSDVPARGRLTPRDVENLADALDTTLKQSASFRDIACIEATRRYEKGHMSPHLVHCKCHANAKAKPWVEAVQNGVFCKDSSHNHLHELFSSAINQCLQWCVFNTGSHVLEGWRFNGQCFSHFGPSDECATKFAHLRP